jgi:hypothetical protein
MNILLTSLRGKIFDSNLGTEYCFNLLCVNEILECLIKYIFSTYLVSKIGDIFDTNFFSPHPANINIFIF